MNFFSKAFNFSFGLKVHGTFYFYGALQAVAVVWGFITIPDNRGLSLVKVENNYDKKTEAAAEEEPLGRN